MGGAAQWGPQMGPLAQGREVIAVDLPGFGGNSHLDPLASIGGFADWVIDNLSRRGIARYDLLGHSMGGMIVQEMARRDAARIDRLIMYATGAVGVLPGRFETIDVSKQRAQADGPRATARRIAATWFLEREQDPAFEGCAAIAEAASLGAIMAGLDAMQGWSGADSLNLIKAKTLVIWGDGDRTYPWEQIARLWTTVPGAGLSVVPGCAHAVHLEKPDLFNAILLDFLSAAPLDADQAR